MPENQNIEYKEIWKDEYFKQTCAFVNSDGGEIIIGINHRNAIIADIFFKAGYIETWGRGISLIFNACKTHNLPEPII